MPRIGLHMIVKNEAHVIERCLRSVLPLIDWWVISDTGSSDGTQQVVRQVMDGVPGRLVEHPWVDFGHNRQQALDAARALPEAGPDDYVLWIDADEQLVDLPAALPPLTADGYYLPVEFDDLRYARLAVVRLNRPWRWRSPIHEYLDLPGAELAHLAAPRVLVRKEGARSLDPDTYRKDVAVLEAALRQTPDDPRLQFYLAQSWRDAGEVDRALAAYRVRAANLAGWDQERYQALHQVGRCLELLERPEEAIAAYLTAYDTMPTRAESLVDAARLERTRQRYEVALIYARAAVQIPHPDGDALFVDEATYRWRAWDEFAVNCSWTGRIAEGQPAAQRALAAHPDDERLRANVAWFAERSAIPDTP